MFPTEPVFISCQPIAPVACIHPPQPCPREPKFLLLNFLDILDGNFLSSSPWEKIPLNIHKLVGNFDILIFKQYSFFVFLPIHIILINYLFYLWHIISTITRPKYDQFWEKYTKSYFILHIGIFPWVGWLCYRLFILGFWLFSLGFRRSAGSLTILGLLNLLIVGLWSSLLLVTNRTRFLKPAFTVEAQYKPLWLPPHFLHFVAKQTISSLWSH